MRAHPAARSFSKAEAIEGLPYRMPYSTGTGGFGGLVPFRSTLIVAETGSMYAGLIYPIIIALITFFFGMKFLPETYKTRIWDEVDDLEPSPQTGKALPA